ncbi:hypothetical protein JXA05_02050 [Candidatus Peregrinibacteria bacterium]|nr:hypothetical protein [Candidatus Peregrinibacteria bacterium]
MASSDQQSGEPKPADRDYVEIVKSDIVPDPQYIKDTGVPAKIVYYCLDCQKIVPPKRIGNKFRFGCTVCNGENVTFGTEKSIANYYRLHSAKKETAEKQK